MVGIIEPLEYDAKYDVMKAFKIILPFLHPTCHVPPVKFSDDINISPVEGYKFSHCQSMQDIQCITDKGGCNKYWIKYIGRTNNQNYVIVFSDGHTNGKFITETSFLNNTKLYASKYIEDKKLNTKRGNIILGDKLCQKKIFYTIWYAILKSLQTSYL